MNITHIWRFPVKSMQGETLTTATVDSNGIVGDRHWCLRDVDSGRNLTARREPKLLFASAKIVGVDPLEVEVAIPDGPTIRALGTDDDDRAINAALSDWIGRAVELRVATSDGIGTYETQADETETGDWFTWQGPPGSYHDSTRTRVSVVSASTMRDWDPRRFRINVIVDGDSENELVGQSVEVGTVTLDVLKQIDRCVMTTRPQPGGIERDLSVLKTLVGEMDNMLGIGAVISAGGTITVGDAITIRHTSAGPEG